MSNIAGESDVSCKGPHRCARKCQNLAKCECLRRPGSSHRQSGNPGLRTRRQNPRLGEQSIMGAYDL